MNPRRLARTRKLQLRRKYFRMLQRHYRNLANIFRGNPA